MAIHFAFKTAVAALALGAFVGLAATGDATAEERVRWKMASTFPGSLTQLGTGGKFVEKQINEVSGGSFRIKFFEPKALVPPFEIFDAVAKGAIDAGWSASGYWVGKIRAAGFFTAVPFGPSAGEYMAWLEHGGGQEIWDGLYAPHGVKGIPCAMIAPEASGWFREEIKSVDDLKGLKMRFFGLGAKVMEKMGVSTQLLAGGDIFPALERGTIDATEFSQPAIDLKLGFYQLAKHYYFPGWHQQSSILEVLVNLEKWNALSGTQKAQLNIVCKANMQNMLAEGEAIQIAALKELRAKGVMIHRWPDAMLDTLKKAWLEVVSEESAKDADFKRTWESLSAFRKDYATWKDLGYLK